MFLDLRIELKRIAETQGFHTNASSYCSSQYKHDYQMQIRAACVEISQSNCAKFKNNFYDARRKQKSME